MASLFALEQRPAASLPSFLRNHTLIPVSYTHLDVYKRQELTVARQQMVEIAKGISYHSRVLIMDEPTAALAVNEIEELFRVIRQLKEDGISIIYISHRLEELFEITDRITVMRDGCYIDTMETKESSMEALIQKMVGRTISWEKKMSSCVRKDADIVLEVKNMISKDIRDISFVLRRGEILGLAGLMGAGRTELARLIFGADWYRSGKIYRNSREVRIRSTSDAVANGISYLSEDRKGNGLAIDLSVADNVALPNWDEFTRGIVINVNRMEEAVETVTKSVSVKTPSIGPVSYTHLYGQTAGIVTMEDILEEIVGSIMDEYDVDEEFIAQAEDGSYIISGMAPLDEVAKTLDIEFEEDDYDSYDTINGFLISRLDRIPQEGEQTEVEYQGYGFKILQVENKMIHTIRVQKLVPPPDTPPGPENGGESPADSENSLPD